jgi:hypothetical protein
MENQNSPQSTLVLSNTALGIAMLASAILLLIAFFLPNYTATWMEFNGYEIIRLYAEKSENLANLFDDFGGMLMLVVPVLYVILSIFALVSGLQMMTGKRAGMAFLLFSGFVTALTLLGFFFIDKSGNTPLVVSKLVPKPTTGYFLAFIFEIVILACGLLSFRSKSSASNPA